MKYFAFLCTIMLLYGCDLDSWTSDVADVGVVMAYRPVYGDSTNLDVSIQDPRPIDKAGKIYSYQDLLIVNEVGKGIHLYDNIDPANPVKLNYVSIPGNHDVAIKNGILYADSYADLLALEITRDTVQVLKRIADVMPFSSEMPPQESTYFECVDPAKGLVIGWEITEIENPKCYRP